MASIPPQTTPTSLSSSVASVLKAQKLGGTFGPSLNEKELKLPFHQRNRIPSDFSSSDVRRALEDVFEEEDEDELGGYNENSLDSSGRKDSGVDPGGPAMMMGDSRDLKSTQLVTRIHHSYELDDELSAGYPSDLPSGLVDIEGNIIGEYDMRFGIEEDELSSVADDEHYNNQNNKNPLCNNVRDTRSLKPIRSGLLNSTCSLNRENHNDIVFHNNSSSNNVVSENPNNRDHSQNYYPAYQELLPLSPTSSSHGKMIRERSSFNRKRRSRSPHAPLDRNHSSGANSNNNSITLTQHYYPEGGWGFVILMTATSCQTLLCGMQLSFGILMSPILNTFGEDLLYPSGWLGAVSLGISLFLSPVFISVCKKKSTRLSAVFGGLVASLGCLFTSFASQFHQLFVSYGAFMGIGVGLTRDASTLMVGQYFKRKREMVEIIVVSGSGVGIVLMSVSIHSAISSLGWRLGLQAITVALFLTFFLSTCYRSASLYHPQRRAILHLKNQKRKVKEKEKRDDKPPFIDYSCLRSKTLQILLLSSAFTAFGMYNPLFSLALECSKKGLEGCSLLLLHVYVGTAWVVGACLFGLLVIQKSRDCRVSKQYLAQVASVICGISILALTAVKGNSGMVIFAWVYGFSLGGYNYALKVYTYERVRARHFPRAWSFVQSVQSVPLLVGVPLTGHINQVLGGWKSGYYLSALSIFIGAGCLFLTDVRRRKMSRRKASQNSSMKTCETTDGTQSPKSKRLSFSFPIEPQQPQQSKHDSDEDDEPRGGVDPEILKELTCISEEGLIDGMDFQDIYFEEWAEYFGDITSCNKVENCLASEYDPDYAVLVERRARRWSAARQSLAQVGPGGIRGGPNVNSKASTSAGVLNPNKSTKTSTVLGVPMINSKLFRLKFDNRSHNPQQQGTSASTSMATGSSGSSSTPPRSGLTFLQSHIKGRGGASNAANMPPPRSFSVIDEDSV